MKVKREDWNRMTGRVQQLENQLREMHQYTLMPISTGEVLIRVIVPALLDHLNLEARHGHAGLFPKPEVK